MKGISRKIDDLGRIVIPKEIRTNLNIKENTELQIYVDDKKIILEKYSKLENIEKFISLLLKNIYNINNKEIIITDKEKIIKSNEKITDELKSIIDGNIDKKGIDLRITDEKSIKCNLNIIREDYIPIGAVVTVVDELTDLDDKLSDLVVQILTNYLDL